MRTYACFFFVANVVVLSCSSCSIRRFYRLFFIVPVVDINNCTSFWTARMRCNAKSPNVFNLTFSACIKVIPSRIMTECERSNGSSSGRHVASLSSWWLKSAFNVFLIVPSSWNIEIGTGSIGKDRIFSIVTSSRQPARTNARRNTSSW
jgi:hypothetical protein